jgi:signal transduction histidine kinase/CheY-like chemotaxis protein
VGDVVRSGGGTATAGAEDAYDHLRRWVLERAVGFGALGVPLLCGLIAFRAFRNGELTTITSGMCLAGFSFPVLWALRNRLSLTVLGLCFLFLLNLTAFGVQLRGGVTTSAAAIPMLVIIMSGLLFGRRGALLGLTCSLLIFGVAGTLVVNDIVPHILASMWDPSNGHVWVRSAVVLLVFGAAAAFSVVYVLDHLRKETAALRATLEREQAERTAREQAEAERAQVQQQLVEAYRLEALGRLAGGVAHDFNNILTVIVGSAELAQQDPTLVEDTRNGLHEIELAAQRGAALTHELLLLGRKDAAAPLIVDLSALLERVHGTLRRVLPSDIDLFIDCAEVQICAEPLALERVLLNLVVNARDAITGRGTIEIEVRADSPVDVAGLPLGDHVRVSVRDTGSGMSLATQERLFEPFFTTKGPGKGTGLGMPMVQSFVQEAGGVVRVRSAPGAGTTIDLYFPRVYATVAPVEVQASFTISQAPVRLQGATVLVVEDHPVVRAAMERSLSKAGLQVLQASDGDLALEFISDTQLHFDMLCLDGVIPGVSSGKLIEVARQLRPHTPVLVCSGYIEEELLKRGIRAGDVHY